MQQENSETEANLAFIHNLLNLSDREAIQISGNKPLLLLYDFDSHGFIISIIGLLLNATGLVIGMINYISFLEWLCGLFTGIFIFGIVGYGTDGIFSPTYLEYKRDLIKKKLYQKHIIIAYDWTYKSDETIDLCRFADLCGQRQSMKSIIENADKLRQIVKVLEDNHDHTQMTDDQVMEVRNMYDTELAKFNHQMHSMLKLNISKSKMIAMSLNEYKLLPDDKRIDALAENGRNIISKLKNK